MARIPITGDDARLDLVQGGTLDETWTFVEPDGSLTDLSAITATLRIARDFVTPSFLVLTSAGKTTVPTDGDGLYIVANTIRFFITAATLGAWDETDTGKFVPGSCDDPAFRAVHSLLFTDGSQPTVEAIGVVGFSPIAQPA